MEVSCDVCCCAFCEDIARGVHWVPLDSSPYAEVSCVLELFRFLLCQHFDVVEVKAVMLLYKFFLLGIGASDMKVFDATYPLNNTDINLMRIACQNMAFSAGKFAHKYPKFGGVETMTRVYEMVTSTLAVLQRHEDDTTDIRVRMPPVVELKQKTILRGQARHLFFDRLLPLDVTAEGGKQLDDGSISRFRPIDFVTEVMTKAPTSFQEGLQVLFHCAETCGKLTNLGMVIEWRHLIILSLIEYTFVNLVPVPSTNHTCIWTSPAQEIDYPLQVSALQVRRISPLWRLLT